MQGEPQDLLIFMTARYHLAVVSYNKSTGELVTRAYGDIKVYRACGHIVFCVHMLKKSTNALVV